MAHIGMEAEIRVDRSIPGFIVFRHARPEPWDIVLRSESPQDWIPYNQAESPLARGGTDDTTIFYRRRAYRIHEAEANPGGGWTYRLKPWPEDEVWVRRVELSPESVQQGIDAERRERHIRNMHRISPVFEILLGWLPAASQMALARKLHFDTACASRRNSLGELALGLYVMSLAFLYPSAPCLWLSAWFTGEGLLRWFHSGIADRPFGLLPLEMGERLFLLFRRALSREPLPAPVNNS